MIVEIEGVIKYRELTKVYISVAGLTYEVNISLNCNIPKEREKISLYTTFIVKEESQTLYGFLDLDEKKLFETLLKITGVGPKVAIAICSTFTPIEFKKIIDSSDVKSLTKVVGIGLKGAKKILLELSDFQIESKNLTNNSNLKEASLALASLGFKSDLIEKTLSKCDSSKEVNQIVKEALSKIQSIR